MILYNSEVKKIINGAKYKIDDYDCKVCINFNTSEVHMLALSKRWTLAKTELFKLKKNE